MTSCCASNRARARYTFEVIPSFQIGFEYDADRVTFASRGSRFRPPQAGKEAGAYFGCCDVVFDGSLRSKKVSDSSR